MFSEELEKIDWEETTKAIYSKTESDVLRALGKEHCDVDDFMALISPAAAKYLEPMAQLSKKYTEERFGKTISMFIPLYITNSYTQSMYVHNRTLYVRLSSAVLRNELTMLRNELLTRIDRKSVV